MNEPGQFVFAQVLQFFDGQSQSFDLVPLPLLEIAIVASRDTKAVDMLVIPVLVEFKLMEIDDEFRWLGILLLKPCLLYTSPSPRDATLSRMPSSA